MDMKYKLQEVGMSKVRRVYVEKKPEFAVKAKDLKHEISSYLGIKTVTNVRVLVRYDVEGLSEDTYNNVETVIISNEQDVEDILKIYGYTGFYHGIDQIGTWVWNDKKQRFIKSR